MTVMYDHREKETISGRRPPPPLYKYAVVFWSEDRMDERDFESIDDIVVYDMSMEFYDNPAADPQFGARARLFFGEMDDEQFSEREVYGMTVAELIAALEAAPNQEHVAAIGFSGGHSYRGRYGDLAFDPAANVTVAKMLEAVKSMLGRTIVGYKDGESVVTEWTYCWIAPYGVAPGDAIGPVLVKYLTGMEHA